MRRHFGWGLVSVFALSVTGFGAASAADMAVKARPMPAPVAVYDWTGFYAGVNLGGTAITSDVNGALDPLEPTAPAAQKAAINQIISPRLRDGTVIGGIQAGYNWQKSNWLLGLEADIDGLHGRGSATVNPWTLLGVVVPGNSSTQSFQTNYLATIRGRAGIIVQNRLLLYVTGGLAVADFRSVDTVAFAGPATAQTTIVNETRFGWVVGAGAEYAITNNWSAKLEYIHADLGRGNSAIPPYPGFVFSDVQFSHRYTEDIGRVGLNYKWGGPVVAKY